jgi:hypothetical protein
MRADTYRNQRWWRIYARARRNYISQFSLGAGKRLRNINDEAPAKLSRLDSLAYRISDRVGTMGFFSLVTGIGERDTYAEGAPYDGARSAEASELLTSRWLTAVDSALNVDADAGRAVLGADLRQHRRADDERADATTQASRFLQTFHCTVTRARARSRFIQLPPLKFEVRRAHLCRDLARLVPPTLSDKVCYSHPCCRLESVSRNPCLGAAHSTLSLMISRWCSFASTT